MIVQLPLFLNIELNFFRFSFQKFFLKHAFSQYSTAEVDSTYLEPLNGSPLTLSYTCEQSSQTEWTTTWIDEDNLARKEFHATSQIALPISDGYLFNKDFFKNKYPFIVLFLSPFFKFSFPYISLFRFHDIEWKNVLKFGKITIVKSPKSQVFSKVVESTVCPITPV